MGGEEKCEIIFELSQLLERQTVIYLTSVSTVNMACEEASATLCQLGLKKITILSDTVYHCFV